jgi:hypothetical protein
MLAGSHGSWVEESQLWSWEGKVKLTEESGQIGFQVQVDGAVLRGHLTPFQMGP